MNIMMFLHAGSLNRGCEAIVRSGADIIKEKVTDSKIYLGSFDPKTDSHIPNLAEIFDARDNHIKKYSIDWIKSALKVKINSDESYAYQRIHSNIIKRINEMDICLSIGGDNYCYGEQPGWYEINKQIKKSGKKLVLWGASIGEEDMSKEKLEDLKTFDLILARETLTYKMLLEKGLTNVKLCADGAFTMEKEELPLPNGWKDSNTIGLNFSPLVLNKNRGSKEAIEKLIQYILDTTDMTICLTPHVTIDGNNDFEILNEYYEKFKFTNRVIILPDNLNAIQYKGYISRMRFFIGARTHATIAAYSNCVPTLVLGYSVKSRGIAKDIFGEEKLVLGINDISDFKKLKTSLLEMINEEEELRNRLNESIPNIKKMSYKAGEYLAELASR